MVLKFPTHACRTQFLPLHDRRFLCHRFHHSKQQRQSLQFVPLCDSDRTLFVLGMVKIIPMPYGGSITLFSMLAATGYFMTEMGSHFGKRSVVVNLIIDPVILVPDAGASDHVFGVRLFRLSGFFQQ